MDKCRTRTGIAALVFTALLLAFNWPVLTIPATGTLLSWLFITWGLAIALLGLAALVNAHGRRSGQARNGQQHAEDACELPDGRLLPPFDDRPGSGDV